MSGQPQAEPGREVLVGSIADLSRRSQALQSAAVADELASLREMAATTERARVSEGTLATYEHDWEVFTRFCERVGFNPYDLTGEPVRLFVTDLDRQIIQETGRKSYTPSTITRMVAAIAHYHRLAHLAPAPSRDPGVKAVLSGMRREYGRTGHRVRRMTPLLETDIIVVLAAMDHATFPAGVFAARDTAAILFGFVGALRRSEVSGLTCGAITKGEATNPAGQRVGSIDVFLTRSKTDQEAEGRTIGLPQTVDPALCAPCAWTRWSRILHEHTRRGRPGVMAVVLNGTPYGNGQHVCTDPTTADLDPDSPWLRAMAKGGHIRGAVTGQSLNSMLGRAITSAGLNATGYGFHSLRAGFVTQTRRDGADARAVRLQTRHASDTMVDLYDRDTHALTRENAVWTLGRGASA